MRLTKAEKIKFLAELFPYKSTFLETAVTAECSMFYECELYDVEDFRDELLRILHVRSPFPERKVNEQFLQLTLF